MAKKAKPTVDAGTARELISQYVGVVYAAEDQVEIRCISSSLRPISEWTKAYALVEATPRLQQLNEQGYNIYVGVGARTREGGRSNDEVSHHRCLVADFDKVGLREVRDQLLHSDVPSPTLIVATGNGYHAYWKLDAPIMAGGEGPSWSDYQRGIIASLSEIADQRIKDNARILRLPGTYNMKNADAPLLCDIVEYNPTNVYSLELFTPVGDTLPDMEEIELPEGKLDLHPSTLRKLKNFPQAGNWNVTAFEVAVDFAGRNWPREEATKIIEASAKPVNAANRSMLLSTIKSAYSKKRSPVGWGSDDDEDYIEFVIDQQIKGGPKSVREKAKARGETPLPLVRNVIVLQTDEEEKKHFVTAGQIARTINEGTGGWPRRMNGELFAIHEGKIKFLKDTDQFFAWLHRVTHLYWTSANSKVIDPRTKDLRTPITKKEFFEYLRTETDDYRGYEELPHEPLLHSTFYAPLELPDPTGEALSEFLDHLNPATEDDRRLMLAMLLTPGAGLPPGTRPAFIITSEFGRGVGKTTTAQLIAEVWGGAITVGESEDDERVRARLLDDAAAGVRVVVVDNIRKKLASSGIEAAITAPWIDGKKMYIGQQKRRNDLTWVFTANNPALSTDLTDRGVPIKIGETQHASDFARWKIEFFAEHRMQLLADCLDILRQPVVEEITAGNKDRWSLWQDAVLARIEGANHLAELIRQRRPQMDDDKDLASEMLTHIENWLHRGHTDYESLRFKIKSSDLMHMLTTGVKLLSRKQNDSTRQFVPYMRQLCSVTPLLGRLAYSQRYHAFVYEGKDAAEGSKLLEFDPEVAE